MKPRRPIARQSPRRTKEAREYTKLYKVFLDEHAYCFRCGHLVLRWFRQTHHFFGRVGALLCWVPGFRMVCPPCHEWIETHRTEASRLGYRAPEAMFGRPSKVIPKSP